MHWMTPKGHRQPQDQRYPLFALLVPPPPECHPVCLATHWGFFKIIEVTWVSQRMPTCICCVINCADSEAKLIILNRCCIPDKFNHHDIPKTKHASHSMSLFLGSVHTITPIWFSSKYHWNENLYWTSTFCLSHSDPNPVFQPIAKTCELYHFFWMHWQSPEPLLQWSLPFKTAHSASKIWS